MFSPIVPINFCEKSAISKKEKDIAKYEGI
jgi:hypothetical protein